MNVYERTGYVTSLLSVVTMFVSGCANDKYTELDTRVAKIEQQLRIKPEEKLEKRVEAAEKAAGRTVEEKTKPLQKPIKLGKPAEQQIPKPAGRIVNGNPNDYKPELREYYLNGN